MLKTFFMCLTLCVALEAQPRLPKRWEPASSSVENKPSGSNLSPVQQGNVEKLKSDLEAIKGKLQVTPQMKQQLAADLAAMAEGATKPSQATTKNLVDDLTAATSDKILSSREIAQLSNDFYKVLNGAGISAAEFNAAVSDAQALLGASGVSSADAARIASDLKAIGAEVQDTAQVRKKFGRR